MVAPAAPTHCAPRSTGARQFSSVRRFLSVSAISDEVQGGLAELRKGFYSLQTEGTEFLIATDENGRLDLSQTFIVDVDDNGEEIFSEPLIT